MDEIAERYVGLALALGRHDPDYVDAYYGPAGWRRRAEDEALSPAEIAARAREALTELGELAGDGGERAAFLAGQLTALAARADILGGRELGFDEESAALYGVVAPARGEEELAAPVAELDGLLPGTGDVAERYAAYQAAFVVPPDRLEAVVAAALAECRRRTAARLGLPADERFELEFVTGRPGGGESRYLGGARSRIEIGVDLPVRIDALLDLAAHEGYPGHHATSVLIDQHLVRERGWLELTVLPLYSPLALVMEGTAVLAADVAFPGDERLAYERAVLYPLAGLDAGRAEEYHRVRAVARGLDRTAVEVARRYLDGTLDRAGAIRWITGYELLPPEKAARRLDFAERFRSYVVNYSVGPELVRTRLDALGGTADDPDRQWAAYRSVLLDSPRLTPYPSRPC